VVTPPAPANTIDATIAAWANAAALVLGAPRHLAGTDHPSPRDRARASSARPPEPGALFRGPGVIAPSAEVPHVGCPLWP
jgi:hypothetical protein